MRIQVFKAPKSLKPINPLKPLLSGLIIFSVCSFTSFTAFAAEEKVDLTLINKIRDEGINRSKIMETLHVLTDEIGPRLTGSPGLRKAGEWTKSQLAELGMVNARTESFAPFGRNWSVEKATIRMTSPSIAELIAIPKAWTGSTDGLKRAKVVFAKLETDEDLAKWKGKLNGVVLLRSAPSAVKPQLKSDATRYSAQQLAELVPYELAPTSPGGPAPAEMAMMRQRAEFAKKVQPFLVEEKVLATLTASFSQDGTVFVQGGGSYKNDAPAYPFPTLSMAAEHYNRLYRLVERKKDVEVEIDVKVNFTEEDPNNSINVLADFPGSDKKDEIVMLGGHLDSWHGGTGATDNAAGTAVAMEALRILKAIGFTPRRTIRIGLWGGEEQGLLGSRDFVKKYVGAFPQEPKEKERGLNMKPLHSKISAYFNLDSGYGKIRGIYAENNAQVKPIFDAWLAPFHDLGATTNTLREDGGTDHESFDDVGIPAFNFMQDPMEYDSRTHHSNMDVFDKVQKADMMQAAIVMASFVAHAANRDEMLPRKPLPKASARGH